MGLFVLDFVVKLLIIWDPRCIEKYSYKIQYHTFEFQVTFPGPCHIHALIIDYNLHKFKPKACNEQRRIFNSFILTTNHTLTKTGLGKVVYVSMVVPKHVTKVWRKK